jgi:hypothetical protein
MSEDKGNQRRGKGRPLDSERAKELARRRWQAPGSRYDQELARRFEGPGGNAKALESWNRQVEEGRALHAARLAEQGELEPSPPSSSASTGMGTPHPSASGDLTKFPGTAKVEQPQPPDQVLPGGQQAEPESAPTSERCTGCGQRWKLSESTSRRESHLRARGDHPGLSDDERARRSRCRAWLASPPQDPRDAHRAELEAERKWLAVIAQEKARERTRATRQNAAPVPGAPASGVLPVIRSTCTVCSVGIRALTKFGIDELQRRHLAASEACRRWADERQVTETFDQAVVHVPAEEHATLAQVEPQPPRRLQL